MHQFRAKRNKNMRPTHQKAGEEKHENILCIIVWRHSPKRFQIYIYKCELSQQVISISRSTSVDLYTQGAYL